MPRGIPKAGKRSPGGGRKPTIEGERKVVKRVSPLIAEQIDEIRFFIEELDIELTAWESEMSGLDMRKNPRYDKAKKLVGRLRERMTALKLLNSED